SEHGALYFHENGKELYFGTAEKPEPEIKDTLTEDEKVSVDIWNWKDPLLQSQQLKELEKEEKRNFSAVYFPAENKGVQLATPDQKDVLLDIRAQGPLSLAYDRDPYRKNISWESSRYKDVYLVNRKTGERRKILEKTASTVRLSPFQHYVGWFNIADSSWYVYDVRNATLANVTGEIGVPFYNEQNDIPEEAGPYGIAGWTKDEQLVVYDRFDLWQIDPSGKKAPVNLTEGEGRKNEIRFRYVKLDPEEIHLPNDMLLRAFNVSNKKAGYYALDTRNNLPEQLIYGDFYFRSMKKAKDADRIIWTKESFTLFPDLYTSDLGFEDPVRITEANPQQKDYNWGTTELVHWVNFDGDSLEGILVKPENFDPGKKYPMLVYFYERSSNLLNVYRAPKPIRSTINWTYYASNGYIIFIPDIVYNTGYPGPSAFNCVVSGTQEMCNRFSFIDRNRLGIQGQSWGGYQTAYIITQTDMFAAAMAGAPVSNMTSAYGGIRWGTGLSRAFQYEESQSRIGATLWERRDLYILNSPLFFANQVNTPLLMMHNDKDGAVPWYQGIEFFNALRRLDKPVWMLVYNNAPQKWVMN
ncbi:MAG: prolyl oligopeptidase family serine peptidase, partial [bacterium]